MWIRPIYFNFYFSFLSIDWLSPTNRPKIRNCFLGLRHHGKSKKLFHFICFQFCLLIGYRHAQKHQSAIDFSIIAFLFFDHMICSSLFRDAFSCVLINKHEIYLYTGTTLCYLFNSRKLFRFFGRSMTYM